MLIDTAVGSHGVALAGVARASLYSKPQFDQITPNA